MERKVKRVLGDRSQEEQRKLQADIREAQENVKKQQVQLNLLTTSNKQLQDEKRNMQRSIEIIKKQQESLDTINQELRLENEMADTDLRKVTKKEEKTLVQHEIMKLEIKRLRDVVNEEADKVYGLENRKYQLEMSMEEREKEIQVHKDILVSE